MAYCKKCGRKIDAESRFCPDCGTPVELEPLNVSVESEYDADDSTSRRQVYVGLIRKCPSCGAELPSNAAVCPQCGFELNTRKGAQAIQDFSNQLNEIDERIAAAGYTKEKGWSTWGTWKRIGWVLLNIYTICLPILIPWILKQIRILTIKPRPRLTALEERKAEIIQNYVVPNEKGAMVESLRFIRTKVEALNRQSKSEQLMYWMNLWAVKAGQINSKARESLKDDVDISSQYEGVNRITSATNKSMRISSGVKLAIILIVLLMIIVPVFSGSKSSKTSNSSNPSSSNETASVEEEAADLTENAKQDRSVDGYDKFSIGGLSFQVPSYYGATEVSDNDCYYAETGQGIVMLQMVSIDQAYTNREFLDQSTALFNSMFDGMKEASDGSYTIDVSGIGNYKQFTTKDNGYVAVMTPYTYTYKSDDMTVTSDALTVIINNEESGQVVSTTLFQSKDSEYNYFNDFAKMVGAVEKE